MTTIDVETGLPQLPADQWWSVRKITGTAHWMDYYGRDSVRVAIMTKGIVRTDTPQYRTNFWGRRAPNGFTVVETEEDKIVASGDVYNERFIDGITDNRMYPDDVTPADILRTAISVFERRNREIIAASVLGDYPPKKLVAPDKGEADANG